MIPNLLSLSRIFLSIPVILLFSLEFYFFASAIFILAALTDLLDGYLARKFKLNSDLGSLLDLIADKILVTVVIIWLAYHFQSTLLVVLSILIISRELTISHIRAFLASKNSELLSLKADKYGKLKTFFLMTSISCLLVSPVYGVYFYYFSLLILIFSVLLSLFSLQNYLREWQD